MNILVTAIGSLSAKTVINALQQASHKVFGCDIHPAQWLYTSQLVDGFRQTPLAYQEEKYIQAINAICESSRIDLIIPLTDVEVDTLSLHREKLGARLALMSAQSVALCRDKYAWWQFFSTQKQVKTVPTALLTDDASSDYALPVIIKPRNGRSSEGLRRIATQRELDAARTGMEAEKWIVQPVLHGDICVVDIVRQAESGQWAAVARKELIRSANGAGLTVQMMADNALLDMAADIARLTGVNGCINMEFISNEQGYFLMDINPRFSAGVNFSHMAGYDMVNNHLRCFLTDSPEPQISCPETIYTRHYVETENQRIN